MLFCFGPVVVYSKVALCKNLSSLVSSNSLCLCRYGASFQNILQLMRVLIRTPPVSVIFADDDEFLAMFLEDIMPILLTRSTPSSSQQPPSATSGPGAKTTSTGTPRDSTHITRPSIPTKHKLEVIDLLDDD